MSMPRAHKHSRAYFDLCPMTTRGNGGISGVETEPLAIESPLSHYPSLAKDANRCDIRYGTGTRQSYTSVVATVPVSERLKIALAPILLAPGSFDPCAS